MEQNTWRVAFVTDVHIRDSEIVLHGRLLAETVEQITAWGPDLILVGGDMAGLQVPHKATVAERNGIARTLNDLARCAPVICARGNHDFPGDWSFLSYLPGVTWIEGDPSLVTIDAERAGQSVPLSVLVLPWLDRSRFAPGADYPASVRASYRAAFRGSAEDLAETRAAGGACFLLGHAAVVGASLRVGQPPVPTEDPVTDLAELLGGSASIDAGFFGHYHSPQDLGWACRYGGSLFVNEYGEDLARGWTSWTSNLGFSHHPIAQPMRAVVRYAAGDPFVGSSDPAEFAAGARVDKADLAPGAKLKLVVSVPSPSAISAARVEALRYASGFAARGVETKIVFEIAREERSRAGAVETARAVTMRDKFAAWAATSSEGRDLEPRAFGLLAEIEGEIDSQGLS